MVAGHLQEKNGMFYIVLTYPGAAGKRKNKWISTKLPVKGNKKKYTADFTVTGKQKGKKLKVAVCTYQNPVYKGYSPAYKKKVKVRK